MGKKEYYLMSSNDSATVKIVADSPEHAREQAKKLAMETGKKVMVLKMAVCVAPEKQEEQKTENVNEKITTWQQAYDYLCLSDEKSRTPFHKPVAAFIKLLLIAKAWNHANGFTPDFRNAYQEKWRPIFHLDMTGKFAFAFPEVTYVYLNCAGLFFETRERAEQFGRQFIDLWNDFLLYQVNGIDTIHAEYQITMQ
jgi:hypothetical protein